MFYYHLTGYLKAADSYRLAGRLEDAGGKSAEVKSLRELIKFTEMPPGLRAPVSLRFLPNSETTAADSTRPVKAHAVVHVALRLRFFRDAIAQ